ncbi:MAG: hypothetical protein GX845_02580, partial [Erysipelothrix sp.]|nr:hypothetical protein [Erysipelothrix sp.]
MKKLVLILALLLMFVGCSNSAEGLPITSANEVQQQLDQDASLIVVIGQSTCSACLQYRPVLREVVTNYDVKLAYVELDKDKAKDVNELVDRHLHEANSTPTTYVFKDGER